MNAELKHGIAMLYEYEKWALNNSMIALRDRLIEKRLNVSEVKRYEVPGDGFQTGVSLSVWKDMSHVLELHLTVDGKEPKGELPCRYRISLQSEWVNGPGATVHVNGGESYESDTTKALRLWRKASFRFADLVSKEVTELLHQGENAVID
jgi:hypothetical protein